MEDVRNDTFSYFSGVIYIAQKAARDTGTLEETMQMKDSIFRSIEDENMPAVEEQLLVYLKRLENEKASSAFYAKYQILDIVKAIYQKYGIYNESLIMQTADEIMNSHDLWKVGEVVSKVIREITVSQKQSRASRYPKSKKSSRMSICMISVWKRSQKKSASQRLM